MATAPAPTTTAALKGLPPPLSTKQIQAQAAAQAQTDISGQTAPLEAQVGTAQRQENQALTDIGKEFSAVAPAVQQGAADVTAGYDRAQVAQDAIFSQANARLNELQQGRAQEAQMLSQQIGGPVAVQPFTQPYDSSIASLINLGAGQQLHTLAYAQAGEQEANAFAGQVFPLVRTEALAKARTTYQNQIKELQDKITSIKATKGTLINTKFADIQEKQTAYALDLAKTKLAALDSDRTYQETVKRDNDARTAANRQFKLDTDAAELNKQKTLQEIAASKATVTQGQETIDINSRKTDEEIAASQAATAQGWEDVNTRKGGLVVDQENARTSKENADTERTRVATEAKKVDADIKSMTAADKRAAAAAGMTKEEFALKKEQWKLTAKLARVKLKGELSAEANAWLDAGLTPQPGKTVRTSEMREIPLIVATKDPQSWSATINGVTHYYHYVDKVETPTNSAITNPNDLVNYMVAHGVARQRAQDAVRNRFGPAIPKSWRFGSKWPIPKKPVPPQGQVLTSGVPNAAGTSTGFPTAG